MEGEISLQDEWDYLFKGGEENHKSTEKALAAELHLTHLRHLAWMRFLWVVNGPTDTWVRQVDAGRRDFDALVEKHVVDPKQMEEEESEKDLLVFNPLSTASDSPWVRYFKNKELEKVIWQDILRTHPDKPFFQQQWVQDQLLRNLFLFSRENGSTGYRQGMHELCSVILFLVDQEKLTKEQMAERGVDPESTLGRLLDRAYLQHDVFTLFTALMQHTNPWFTVVDTRDARKAKGTVYADQMQAEEAAISSAPIIKRCRRIQFDLLKKADPPLCNYLSSLGIEPQLYALKWLRLLFGREFHMEDAVIIWDAILAHGKSLALVDHVAVSMLIYMREQLIGKEYTEVMGRLMKFPPVEDVTVILDRALEMAIPGRPRRAPPSSPSVIEPIVESAVFRPSSARTASVTVPTGKKRPLDAKRLQQAHSTMATQMNRILNELQTHILAEDVELGDHLDKVLMSLAELKQVKDVLNGSLDLEDAMFIGQTE